MKKTLFKTTLIKGSDDLCRKLVTLAAESNGGTPITLAQLKTVAEGNKIQYPTLYGDMSAELVGDNTLHIDRKLGDEYQTVCIIEEVEVFDLEMSEEEQGNALDSFYNALNWDGDGTNDLPNGLFTSPGMFGDN